MEIRRKVKNVVYKYSDPERLVREATSNDPWGPTTTIMSEIADLTYSTAAFEEIMQIIWKRLNDKGKNWRHVYKCLVLLDYLIKCGNEHVVNSCRNNIHDIDTLKDFQYFEDHKDLGLGVREKSKMLVALLKDDEMLNEEREKGQKVKEKFQAGTNALGSHLNRRPGDLGREIRKQEVRHPRNVMKLNFDDSKNSDEDEDLQKAIALSKEEHEKAMQMKLETDQMEELKIKIALEQSKKEEEALSVLRLPPKVSTTIAPVDLLNLSAVDTSQDRTLLNGFGDSSKPSATYDPWGTLSTERAMPVDFDPWNDASAPSNDNIWPGNNNAQKKVTIDDIFGDEKPEIDFPTDWTTAPEPASLFPTSPKQDTLLDSMWATEPSPDTRQRKKTLSGSLNSLGGATICSLDLLAAPEVRQPLSSSAANLAAATRIKRTPQEFLGDSANLINFDNLLPQPKAAPKNPFAVTTGGSGNPFSSVPLQPKMPMNQMGASSTMSFPFSSQPPLVPITASPWAASNTWNMHAGGTTSMNPFLN